MSNQTNDLLFEYLRSILYDNVTQPLDLSLVDEQFMDLAKGLKILDKYIKELKEYTRALSVGNLSIDFPKNNILCMNLKNLHSNLNHLTWQAQQVANGDYYQQVSYLGDFSLAFNQMTEQLKERETLLKKEHHRLHERAKLAQSYNNMLKNLSKKRKEWIFIMNMETNLICYCNHDNEHKNNSSDICKNCVNKESICPTILNHEYANEQSQWQFYNDSVGKYYSVNTFDIVWEGTKSWAHIVEDITDFKIENKHLSNLVYTDPKTGLHNHRYIKEKLNSLMKEDRLFTLAFIDIDHLKSVNDQFGHLEGDNYINFIISSIKSILRSVDIFARIGGDEFLIAFISCPKSVVEIRLQTLYASISKNENNKSTYQRGFSFGVVEFNSSENKTLDQLIKQADAYMYQCKLTHKSSL